MQLYFFQIKIICKGNIMTTYNNPSSVAERRLEDLEREVECSEEEIKIAKRHGMLAWHLEGLRQYCREENRLLILRSSKYEGRKFHFSRAHSAKPVHVKDTTENGEVVVNGKRFFSDYDILSLWQRKGTSYQRVPTCKPELDFEMIYEVIDELNEFIGNRTMFQHGANDEYVDRKGKPKNELKSTETFIAFDENKIIYELFNIIDLKMFYTRNKLTPWVYQW